MSFMRRTALLLAIYLIGALQPGAALQPANGSQQHEAAPAPTSGAAVISETLAVQVMLDRAGFSPGEIDAEQGSNLKRALAAYQAARGMPASGVSDQPTWARLQQDTGNQPPLITYTLTDSDIAGPFTPDIPTDLMQQSKLGALGYQSPLESLGEQFHVRPSLLTALNPGATFAHAGEAIMVPNVSAAAPEPASSVTVVVTKATSALTLLDDSQRVIFHAPVTSGSQHDPLPVGTWKVNGVQQHPTFNYNPALFWDANPTHSKAKIPPGPNNPVGTVWIDISKEHYGIHGTPEPSKIGHVESHGCVRLTNWDAQRVAALVKPGTRVIFQ
jgi:lipoprotein-anchoring transpeptidase ErfK/SrfK